MIKFFRKTKRDTSNNIIVNREDKYLKLTHSYVSLRRTVGWIGVLLPFVLMLGLLLFFNNEETPTSISHYYHTSMRNIFVGSLCSVALFFFFYSGYDKIDNLFGNLAGVFAIGVACIPITKGPQLDTKGIIHYVCAILFFITLIIFSTILFVKSDKIQEKTAQKTLRNRIYRICGFVMIICLLTMALQEPLGLPKVIVFWGETVALFMFGVSWLTKGEALFRDR